MISRPARWIELESPVNLASENHDIFEPRHRYLLPDQEIASLENVQVFGRGPLWHDGRYLPESFVAPEHLDVWKKKFGHWRLALEQAISPKTTAVDPVVWITDNWSCGYFHWFCDALPRLELALKHYPANELTLLLPHKFGRSGYFYDSLRAYDLKQVRQLGRFQQVECKSLILPHHVVTTGNHDPDLVRSIRQRFYQQLHLGGKQPKRRVYISREMAAHRKVANEKEVVETLGQMGFEKVIAERLSWGEQVQLMSETQVMVSNHGSGLTNMIGMQSGSSVLEIRDQSNTFQNCFWSLACAAKVNYYYLLATKTDASQSSHTADVVVDCKSLRQCVGEMIERDSSALRFAS